MLTIVKVNHFFIQPAPEVVAELRKSLYVDDLLSGGRTTEQAQRSKQVAPEILPRCNVPIA